MRIYKYVKEINNRLYVISSTNELRWKDIIIKYKKFVLFVNEVKKYVNNMHSIPIFTSYSCDVLKKMCKEHDIIKDINFEIIEFQKKDSISDVESYELLVILPKEKICYIKILDENILDEKYYEEILNNIKNYDVNYLKNYSNNFLKKWSNVYPRNLSEMFKEFYNIKDIYYISDKLKILYIDPMIHLIKGTQYNFINDILKSSKIALLIHKNDFINLSKELSLLTNYNFINESLNKQGTTLLLFAHLYENNDIINLLVNYGGDIEIKDIFNNNYQDYMIMNDYKIFNDIDVNKFLCTI